MNDSPADRLADLRHTHNLVRAVAAHEVRTRWGVALTFATMVAELVVGYATNSLALLADGWHMATHVGALGLAAFAYWFARRQAGPRVFDFGTGKVHALAGYTSAVTLALVALLMVVEPLRRLLQPEPIAFPEALPVAMLGLLVDLHLWDLGPGARACIVSLAAPGPLAPVACRAAIAAVARLQHVTVEVHLRADPVAAAEVP